MIGWREYVRGIYWLKMPDYGRTNALAANRDLPWFYWSGKTSMNCLAQAIGDTRRHAYAHHIQRLMVTGNFALLAGIAPAQIEAWYLAVYIDAFDWVELPNVHGMVMFADGGLLASKPYAASGAYIDRMSDYCEGAATAPRSGRRARLPHHPALLELPHREPAEAAAQSAHGHALSEPGAHGRGAAREHHGTGDEVSRRAFGDRR